jgi:hypothetical protein
VSEEPVLDELYDSEAEALEAGIRQLRAEGGGTIWIHRDDCTAGGDMEGDCPCSPIGIEVEGAHS